MKRKSIFGLILLSPILLASCSSTLSLSKDEMHKIINNFSLASAKEKYSKVEIKYTSSIKKITDNEETTKAIEAFPFSGLSSQDTKRDISEDDMVSLEIVTTLEQEAKDVSSDSNAVEVNYTKEDSLYLVELTYATTILKANSQLDIDLGVAHDVDYFFNEVGLVTEYTVATAFSSEEKEPTIQFYYSFSLICTYLN